MDRPEDRRRRTRAATALWTVVHADSDRCGVSTDWWCHSVPVSQQLKELRKRPVITSRSFFRFFFFFIEPSGLMFLSHALRFNLRGGSFDLFRFMLGPLISRVVFRPPTQARPCHTTLSRHMEAQSEAPYCQRQEANFSPLHKSSSGFCPSLVSLAWCDSVSVVSP